MKCGTIVNWTSNGMFGTLRSTLVSGITHRSQCRFRTEAAHFVFAIIAVGRLFEAVLRANRSHFTARNLTPWPGARCASTAGPATVRLVAPKVCDLMAACLRHDGRCRPYVPPRKTTVSPIARDHTARPHSATDVSRQLQTTSTGPGYSPRIRSEVRSRMPSTCAWAISIRSNGSPWIEGKPPTAAAWRPSIASSS